MDWEVAHNAPRPQYICEATLRRNIRLTDALRELGYVHSQVVADRAQHKVCEIETGKTVFVGDCKEAVEWLSPGFWKKYHGEE